MDFETLNEYSLWLEPEGIEYTDIDIVIQRFSAIAHVENFVPHVTLLGAISLPKQDIQEYMKNIVQNIPPFEIQFSSLSFGNNPLKTFFLECKESQLLMEANKKAQEICSMKSIYKPHMSLIYGNITQEIKNELVEKTNEYGMEYFSFTPQKISLWHAKGVPSQWKKIYAVEIKKAPPTL